MAKRARQALEELRKGKGRVYFVVTFPETNLSSSITSRRRQIL
jgi:hypothetical protein